MSNEAAAQKKKETEFKQQQPAQDELRKIAHKIIAGNWTGKDTKQNQQEMLEAIRKKESVMSYTPKPAAPVEKAPLAKQMEVETQGTVGAVMRNGGVSYSHEEQIPNLFLKKNVPMLKHA